ncbi:CorA family divalent cation transporter [Acinetobacter baumannii]|uniref:CorA family divalent cation transporter n=1 Tax=Acinetobacter baumannii TaxID=470 RepID=UPI0036D54E79
MVCQPAFILPPSFDSDFVEPQILVSKLACDVVEVKKYASFEYEKVRYLQNAVTNMMNIKQNQIVKVFTIITAVFLSLTLVGTFYEMDFDVMPELSWEHGFLYCIILTLAVAIIPLAYIKYKGWLRYSISRMCSF